MRGSKSFVASGFSSSKGIRTPKTIIVPSYPEKKMKKLLAEKSNLVGSSVEKIDIAPNRRNRVIDTENSYDMRPININIKHK